MAIREEDARATRVAAAGGPCALWSEPPIRTASLINRERVIEEGPAQAAVEPQGPLAASPVKPGESHAGAGVGEAVEVTRADHPIRRVDDKDLRIPHVFAGHPLRQGDRTRGAVRDVPHPEAGS